MYIDIISKHFGVFSFTIAIGVSTFHNHLVKRLRISPMYIHVMAHE